MWAIHNGQKILKIGQGHAPGNPPTAFRSELFAVMSWHCFLHHVLQFYDIKTNISITPFTDNVKVIQYYTNIQQDQDTQQAYMDDYDVFIMLKYYYHNICQRGLIINSIKEIPQYKKDKQHDDDIHIQLHQRVESIARGHRHNGTMPKYISPPQEWIHLRDYTGVITSQEKQVLENNWNAYNLENYYIQRWNTTSSTLQQFDWNIYTKNYERSRPSIQTYIIKMMSGWLPVFYNLNKMDNTNRKCHLFRDSETFPHLFQCLHRKIWKNQFLHHLDTHLRQTKTDPLFATQLHQHMRQLLFEPHEFDHFKHFTVFAGFLPNDWKQKAIPSTSSPINTASHQHRWTLKFSAWITTQAKYFLS